MDEQRFLTVVDRLYATALGDEGWPVPLRLVREALAAGNAVLVFRRVPAGSPKRSWSAAGGDPALQRTCEDYAERSLSSPGFLPGKLLDGSGAASGAFLGIGLIRDAELVAFLVLGRSTAQPEFDGENRRFLERLAPHLQNAIRIRRRVEDLQTRADALSDAVQQLDFGVILLERGERVVFANAAADRIAEARDGLTLGAHGIAAWVPGETAELRGLIARAAATAVGSGSGGGGRMALTRPSRSQSLGVFVAPLLPKNPHDPPHVSVVALFVSDPERGMVTPPEMLRRVFDLTMAESRLAVRIAQGKTLEESCAELDIALNTARSQLKAVFSKTGVSRQAELVRLLLTLAAPAGGGRV